jgi:hypothetical protein
MKTAQELIKLLEEMPEDTPVYLYGVWGEIGSLVADDTVLISI